MAKGEKPCAVVFRDDYTQYMWVYFLARKIEAPRALERALSNTRPDGTVEIVGMDDATEFQSVFDEVFDKGRERRETVPPKSPQFTGRVERTIAMLEATAFAARLQAKTSFGIPLNRSASMYR